MSTYQDISNCHFTANNVNLSNLVSCWGTTDSSFANTLPVNGSNYQFPYSAGIAPLFSGQICTIVSGGSQITILVPNGCTVYNGNTTPINGGGTFTISANQVSTFVNIIKGSWVRIAYVGY